MTTYSIQKLAQGLIGDADALWEGFWWHDRAFPPIQLIARLC